MKILMTADAVGGVWQYALDLARGLTRNGDTVLLATLGPRPFDTQRDQAGSISGLTLFESDFALEWMRDPWRDVDNATAWLLDLARRHEVDLIHLNGYSYACADWGRPVIVVAHSCVPSWWRAVHGGAAGSEWNQYRARVSAGLASCDVVVAPTKYMAAALRANYRVPIERIRVVHNFSRAPRREHGAKDRFCLAAGRVWDAAKNLRILEHAASTLLWPIEVAGPNADPQTGTVIQSPLRMLGSVPHSRLLQRMREAAIFVHPALYEPFGLSVLEAARSRCCLVLSDIEPLRELWDRTAIFVDPRDPDAWRHRIEELVNRPALREHMGCSALERSTRYTAFESITGYLHLYSSLRKENKHTGVAA